MNTVFRRGRPVRLDPSALIQSGGEGSVFAWGAEALKVYHAPGAAHAKKLRAWMKLRQQPLPPNLVAPTDLLADGSGAVVGFCMPRLPDGAAALRRLANRHYCLQHAISLHEVLALLGDAARTLTLLHRLGLVVGDLNDRNLLFVRQPQPRVYWIDADSYQLDGLPCPVASEPFLDPRLYSVADFGHRPAYDTGSDHYAFAVLAAQSLLQAHPFGGVHHQLKTIPARVQAGVTLFDSAVTYPRNARPAAILPPALRDHLLRILVRNDRPPLSADFLNQLQRQLTLCAGCGAEIWADAGSCSFCQQAPARPAAAPAGAATPRLLLETEGVLVALEVLPVTGRCRAIAYRPDGAYVLHQVGPGGAGPTQSLFNGQPGYRFFFFGDCLAVQPPPQISAAGDGPLMLLRLTEQGPERLAMTSTGTYRNRPVAAGAGASLLRQAGGYLLRGRCQHGVFTEAIVADARPHQTRIWGAPLSPLVVGFYRLFDQFQPFLLTARNEAQPLLLPPPPLGSRVTDLRPLFGRHRLAFLRTLAGAGAPPFDVVLLDRQGQPEHAFALGPHGSDPQLAVVHADGLLLAGEGALHQFRPGLARALSCPTAAAGDRLLPHPQGWLLWQVNRLYLLPDV